MGAYDVRVNVDTRRDKVQHTVFGRVSKTDLRQHQKIRPSTQCLKLYEPAVTHRDGVDDTDVGDRLANDG